jgi:hypothetical protein
MGFAERQRRRRVGLTKPRHVGGKCFRLLKLAGDEAHGLELAHSGHPQLLVPLIEVLRQLLDDLGLSCRPEPESGQPKTKLDGPIRHDPPP